MVKRNDRIGRLVVWTFVFATLLLAGGTGAADASGFAAAPPSEEYVEYVKANGPAKGESVEGENLGYMPRPLDLSHLKGDDYAEYLSNSLAKGALPARYDLRDRGYVTSAKNQNYNNCWSYSAMGSIESAYLKRTGTALDLSEMHLSWFAYNDTIAFNGGIDNGGYDNNAVALLARWTGAVLEKDCPQSSTPRYSASSYPNRLHLENAYYLALQYLWDIPQPTDDIRKRLVYDYGAISIGMRSASESLYYNPATASYYYNDSNARRSNHAVLLCGWDDNYSRDNFRADNRPSRDGAWLIKNSWGTAWGDSGFFWMSYEDLGFADGTIYLVGEANNYDKNYGYDDLGWCSMIGSDSLSNDTGWFANVFTSGTASEALKAVSFYTTANNARYEIYVYTNSTNSSDPRSGTLVFGPQSGTESFAGYHTVVLSESIALSPNTTFAVVAKMTTPGYYYPIPVEMQTGTPMSDGSLYPYSMKAVIEKGVSYASIDGTNWSDAATAMDANVCLKAFTAGAKSPTPTPTPITDGGSGGGCATVSGAFLFVLAVAFVRRKG